MEPDFSGYVSKANLKCTDGRVIMPGAFKHQDGHKVPVVYQHNHTDANQVLGYAILSDKEDGTWGDIYINRDNPTAVVADSAVKHGSLDKFSVWAKDLVERGEFVHSGTIQEVSLVLSGANAGAVVTNVLMHGDFDMDEMIYIGGEIEHADVKEKEDAPPTETAPPEDTPPAENDKTVGDVLDTLTPEQELAVNAAIDDIVKEALTEYETQKTAGALEHGNISQEGTQQMTNAFEGGQAVGGTSTLPQLKHTDVESILAAAKGGSLNDVTDQSTTSLRQLIRSTQGRELMHAADYGVENIEILFPDAQALMERPTFVDRRQDWVKVWMAGTSHSPFSRVKTYYADITADEARAKGWIKGHQKTEEVFPIFKRETGPTWVIKKQKLDRQDIIDVTSFDIVAWMKAEMRGKLDEEIARAGLFGDGRPAMVNGTMNPDKIQDPGAANTSGNGIRAVVNDHELYATTYNVELDANAVNDAWNVLLDSVTEAGEFYMGSGNKTAFMSFRVATKLLTIRDGFGKRMYRNLDEVAGDMDVSRIQRVPTELFPTDVLCVVLDLADYNYGTNRGGEVTLFDDFDINFNQYHYLIETYLSGALTLPYSAQIFKRVDTASTLVTPTEPAYNVATGEITIPTVTGVEYSVDGTPVADGSTQTVAAGATAVVTASPEAGYHFATNDNRVDTWTFERPAPDA